MAQETRLILGSEEWTDMGRDEKYSEADPFDPKTINQLKGKVTMLFITHQIPRGLQVDEVLSFGPRQQATRMEVVEDERRRDGEEGMKRNEGE
jgi:hypothetical protein